VFTQSDVQDVDNPELFGNDPTIQNAAFACDQSVVTYDNVDTTTTWQAQSTTFFEFKESFVGTTPVPPLKGR
jgi:hypothetical protein